MAGGKKQRRKRFPAIDRTYEFQYLHLHIIPIGVASLEILKIVRPVKAFVKLVEKMGDFRGCRQHRLLFKPEEPKDFRVDRIRPEDLHQIVGERRARTFARRMQKAKYCRNTALLKISPHDAGEMMVSDVEQPVYGIIGSRLPAGETGSSGKQVSERFPEIPRGPRLDEEDILHRPYTGKIRYKRREPISLKEYGFTNDLKLDQALSGLKRVPRMLVCAHSGKPESVHEMNYEIKRRPEQVRAFRVLEAMQFPRLAKIDRYARES